MASFHSQINPTVSAAKTMTNTRDSFREPKACNFSKGKSKISSTSKIKKIKVTKKNCRENVDVFQKLELNPHSKGLFFSKSRAGFWWRLEKIKEINPATTEAALMVSININIKYKAGQSCAQKDRVNVGEQVNHLMGRERGYSLKKVSPL